MKLYTISGIDGSGKTTQMEMLKEHLKKNGHDPAIFHAISFSIATKIKNIFDGSSNSKKQPVAKTSASLFSIFLRKIFLIIDSFRFRFHIRKLSKKGKDVIITDRYFFDQIINILYLEDVQNTSRSPAWLKLTKFFMVTPDRAFYIKTEPKIAMEREREIEQGLDYLKKKTVLYNSLSNRFKYTEIDGDKKKEEVFEEILNLI